MGAVLKAFLQDESGEVALSYMLVAALVTLGAVLGIEQAGTSFRGLLDAVRDVVSLSSGH